MPPGTPLRIAAAGPRSGAIYSSDYKEVGVVSYAFARNAVGLTVATATGDVGKIWFEYIGPNDLISN